MGIWLIVERFAIEIQGTMVVYNSDHNLVNGPVRYSDARFNGTRHLNNKQVKISYADVHYSTVCYSDPHCKIFLFFQDSFLFVFTFLPIRFALALLALIVRAPLVSLG